MKKNTQSNSVHFKGFAKTCTFEGFQTILEVALAHEIPLSHSCGGMGSCTTCRVIVTKGVEGLAPRNELEQEHAQMRGFAANERLGCQTLAVDKLEIEIPEKTLV